MEKNTGYSQKGNKQNQKNDPISKEQDYLNEKNIFDIFHFLLCHVVVHQPENPIQYLYQLIDDMILFRSGLKDPRLFWTEKHVDAMFKNILPYASELLSLNDYKTAMKALGIHSYDPCPIQVVPGYVNREIFCMEALNNMKRELKRITKKGTQNLSCSSFV